MLIRISAVLIVCLPIPGAHPEIWIRGREGVGIVPSPPLSVPSPTSSRPSPPLPLEVGPLNPARGSGGAL